MAGILRHAEGHKRHFDNHQKIPIAPTLILPFHWERFMPKHPDFHKSFIQSEPATQPFRAPMHFPFLAIPFTFSL